MTAATDEALRGHLVRADGQEDLCFAVYHPSRGASRFTGLIRTVVLPRPGDRNVHGNASFNSPYFELALQAALDAGGGVAFMHAHPRGWGWQGMSHDDVDAERSIARAAQAATGLPLLGLTLAVKDGGWSARFWPARARQIDRAECESVRVVGPGLRIHFNSDLKPAPPPRGEQRRSVETWGSRVQGLLGRLRVGVVGTGSVGMPVGEGLARIGVGHITGLDHDRVRLHNRDRLLHASDDHARRDTPKVEVMRQALSTSTTADPVEIQAAQLSVCEEAGYRLALDQDVLFSCVDRPWPRSVLNFIAYAHLIPVVDGGIGVSRRSDETLRGADWRAHVVTEGRRCMCCLGQYDPGLVAADREGRLDDPSYLRDLPGDHPLRGSANVFPFALALASLELLQLLLLVAAPSGISDVGAQHYHFPASTIELEERDCEPGCFAPDLVALGENAGHPGTGTHLAAERERQAKPAA